MVGGLKRIYGLVSGALSFAYLICILNPIQMLSVVFYPFARPIFRNMNRWCARSIWGLWVLMAEIQNGIDVRFTGDPLPRRENALVIPNHQTMADVMLMMCLAWRCGRLGDMKFFVKDIVKYAPGVGWGMLFLDCIFVKRDWARDRQGISKLFGKYKAEHIPIFVVSFLEGTRRTDEKLAQAQAYATERNLRVPKRTLVPRTKGFVATLNGLGDHLDAVYDVTIGYPDFVPTLTNCFERRVKRVEVNVRRYAIADIPKDEQEQAAWVFERFEEKDARMELFQETERFQGAVLPGKISLMDWFRSEESRTAAARFAPERDSSEPT